MYVPKKDFGWNRRDGWKNGDEAAYNACVLMWTNRPMGRTRTKPVHPSWNPYDALFNRNDPTRSQGAFCRWAGIRSSSLSAAKNKLITDKMELKLSEWIEELQKIGHE